MCILFKKQTKLDRMNLDKISQMRRSSLKYLEVNELAIDSELEEVINKTTREAEWIPVLLHSCYIHEPFNDEEAQANANGDNASFVLEMHRSLII
jgi:hypothetical protein